MPSIEDVASSLPEQARFALKSLIRMVGELNTQIEGIETKLAEIGRSHPVSNLLSSISVGQLHLQPSRRPFRTRGCSALAEFAAGWA